ncbi:MAG: hypothetical protein RLZZ86_1236 [Cyanobacteriota bacterium]|jgi:hypothetical protein
MAQYLPPISNQTIFNPLNFPSLSDDLSVQEANSLYLSLGPASQKANGIKTFNNIKADELSLTSATPIVWDNLSFGASSRISPQDNGWNQSFNLPTYPFSSLDTLTANNAIQTLNNKTLGSFKVGANGTATNNSLIQHGRVTQSGSGSFTVTFPTAFALSTTPTVLISYEIGNTSFLFLCQLTAVTRTQFTYRTYLATIANPAQVTTAGDVHTLHWLAIGTA